MAANITSEVTAAQLAAQFGFGTTHGAVAWRVMLNSPLDSERCRVLLERVEQPEKLEHPLRPADSETLFGSLSTEELAPATPAPAVAEFLDAHGPALATACVSQLGEPGKQPWARNTWPLLALMCEASGAPAFATLVRDDPAGRKLYQTYLRGLLRLVRDGSWATTIGAPVEEMPEDAKYTNFTPGAKQADYADVDVLGSLRVVLPVLLRAAAALAAAPGGNALPAQNARAVEHTRSQLAANRAAIAELARVRPEVVWDGDRATDMGARLAYVYAGLQTVSDSLRV